MRQFDGDDNDSLEKELEELFGGAEGLDTWLINDTQSFDSNKIVSGKVLEIRGDDVVIDIGYKSEGVIKLDEWKDEAGEYVNIPRAGDTIEVLLETVEDEHGGINLSYRKAKRQKEWESILAKHKEGDVVTGAVTKKIKGGLLINIAVELPHQVTIDHNR